MTNQNEFANKIAQIKANLKKDINNGKQVAIARNVKSTAKYFDNWNEIVSQEKDTYFG